MICHYCDRQAAGKCVSCGLPICPDHGKRYCQVCSNTVFSRETGGGPGEQKGYLQCPPRPQMETIYVDDDGPPECYKCQAFARKVCTNCLKLFCREHGQGEWCDQCCKANRVGTWMVAAMLGVTVGLFVLFLCLRQKG